MRGTSAKARPPAHCTPLRVCASAHYWALSFLVTFGTAAAPLAAQAPAGTLIVINKSDNTAVLLDLPEGRVVATLPTGMGPHEVAVAPGGRWAVVSNYGEPQAPGHTLTLIDVWRGAVVRTVELGAQRPHGLAWTPDGRTVVVTVEASRAVLPVDARHWTVGRALATGQETSHMVAVSPDGRRAYVGNIGGGSVSLLDLRRPGDPRITQTGRGTEGVAVSPDGREVWAVNRSGNTVSVLDARSLETLATLPCADFPIRVKFTPDGRRVLVNAARSSDLHIFDPVTRQAVGTVPFPLDTARAVPTLLGDQFARSAVPVGVLAAPGNALAYVALSAMGEVVEIDLGSRTVVRRFAVGHEPDGLGYSPVRVRR